MITKFTKYAYNNRSAMYNLWKRHMITNSTGAPVSRKQFQQQCKAYSGSKPKSIHKKVKDVVDLSTPAKIVSAAEALPSSGSKFGFVSWYLGMIKARPVVTKSITATLTFTVADVSEQAISRKSGESYDLLRTLRMAGFGFLLQGVAIHHWFSLMYKVLPSRDIVSTLKKMVLGQLVLGPCLTSVFFSANAALQGENGGEILARLKRDLIPTMISGVAYWPMCDFVNFKFVPVHLQPLASNTFAFIWTIYMTYMASLEKVTTA